MYQEMIHDPKTSFVGKTPEAGEWNGLHCMLVGFHGQGQRTGASLASAELIVSDLSTCELQTPAVLFLQWKTAAETAVDSLDGGAQGTETEALGRHSQTKMWLGGGGGMHLTV